MTRPTHDLSFRTHDLGTVRMRLTVLVALGVLAAAFTAAVAAGRWPPTARVAAPPTMVSEAEPAATAPLVPVSPKAESAQPAPATTPATPKPDREEPTTPEAAEPARPATLGLLMFRGSPDRTFYGTGDLGNEPRLDWRYPDQPMCGRSVVGGESRLWCGSGWTGQPVVWERPDGITEVIFGAYDHQVHFLDSTTGTPTRSPFRTGDIIKGSVTLDPDGYPLLYFGSRDNRLRIVALDRDEPTELWSLDANVVSGKWNNDWDGNPAIVDDVLFEGGENSWFFAVQLGRAYGGDGRVTVNPEILVAHPGYNDELLSRVGSNVSIESSVAVGPDTVYFANSGGRVVGLDRAALYEGEAIEVFDFWMGDDVDATIVLDPDGSMYVAAELERFNERAAEVGQVVKLDPSQPDPLLWSVAIPPREGGDGGVWATPALGNGALYVATHPGELLAIDTSTGQVGWRDEIGFHAWSSPAVVGDTLVVATCTGELRGYSIADPLRPAARWTVQLESQGCIESTPAIWDGRLYVGSRDGFFYAFES